MDERPALSRTNTDLILDYYQSEDAGRLYERPVSSSGGHGPGDDAAVPSSSPASVYSDCNSDSSRRAGTASSVVFFSASAEGVQAPQPRRRMSTRSAGGDDKRRVAVFEMDDDFNQLKSRQPSGSSTTSAYSFSDSSFYDTTPCSSPSVSASPSSNGGATANNTGATSLLTRRGIDGLRFGKLAFVAPPDASPSAYTDLTPPLSAPPQTQNIATAARSGTGPHVNATDAPLACAPSVVAHHQRSQSEAVGGVANKVAPSKRHANRLRKGSRDIGIVGTSLSPTTGLIRIDAKEEQTSGSKGILPDQVSPIFQRPSLPEAPSYSSECSNSNTATTVKSIAAPGLSRSTSKSSLSTLPSSSSHPNTSLMSNNVKSPSSPPHTAHQTAARAAPNGPVVVGHAPQHYWQVPALASTGHGHYAVMSQANGTVLTTAQYVPLSSVVSSPSAQLHRPPSSSPSSSPASTPMSASSPQTQASSTPSSTTSPSSSNNPSMLYYQAGRDATAGPLPSPPRQLVPLSPNGPSSGPPPRPPRMKIPASTSNTSVTDKEKRQSEAAGGSGSAPRTLTNQPSNASISRSPVTAGDHIIPSS